MRIRMAILFCYSMPLVQAQVHLSSSLRMIGDSAQRQVEGLGSPLDVSAAVTVEGAVLGGAHWAAAILTADTLLLSLSPTESVLRDGVVIRFKSPADLSGPLFIRHDQLTALPVVRADGLDPVPGQLIADGVAEVILAVDRYVLTGTVSAGCPPGSLSFNDRACMDINEVAGLNMYEASEHCALRGGRLCTWDEYYAGCTLLGGALIGRFNNWEWIDDTANHTHTGVQAGRNTCMSQRSTQPLLPVSTRCCYHPR